MNGSSSPSLCLFAIFAAVLLAALFFLFYVVFRKRRFRQQEECGSEAQISGELHGVPLKPLFHYFCWRNHSRVEPSGAPDSAGGESPEKLPADGEFEKLHALYGSCKVLYTIKEEKETETDSDADAEAEEAKIRVGGEAAISELTFLTPCSSPPYYTPLSSPARGCEICAVDVVDSSESDVKAPKMGYRPERFR